MLREKKNLIKQRDIVLNETEMHNFGSKIVNYIKAAQWTGRLQMHLKSLSGPSELNQSIIDVEVSINPEYNNGFILSCIHVCSTENFQQIAHHLIDYFSLDPQTRVEWNKIQGPNIFRSELVLGKLNLMSGLAKLGLKKKVEKEIIHPKRSKVWRWAFLTIMLIMIFSGYYFDDLRMLNNFLTK